MRKKYVVLLSGMTLCFIFLFSYYLSGVKKEIKIHTIGDLEKKVTISFTSSWGAYDSMSQKLKIILQNFSDKYKNIEVINKSIAGEDFLLSLKTDFASRNDPDVFGLWPGSDFNLLVQQGKVADLTQILKEDPAWYASFRKETWDYVTFEDKIYGVPFEIIYEGLFINKDLFKKYNVKIPENFEELKEAVVIFKENGVIPIAYSATPEGSYIYQNIVMKLGGKEDVENPFTEDGNIKPCFIQGMYYMKELYELGAFPNNASWIDDKARNDLFLNKRAAMIVQGSWFIGENALSADDETVDIIPFPMIEGGKADKSAIIYGCGNGIFHISQKAWEDKKTREASIALVKELTSVESAKILSSGAGVISNIYIPDEEEKDRLTLRGQQLVNESKELVGPVDSFINRSIWEGIIVEQFPKMLMGRVSPESIFLQVNEKMKYKKQ